MKIERIKSKFWMEPDRLPLNKFLQSLIRPMEPEKYHIEEYPEAFQLVFNAIMQREMEDNINNSNSIFNNASIYELKDYDIVLLKNNIFINDFFQLCNPETFILQGDRGLNIPISIFKVKEKISNFPEHMVIINNEKDSSNVGTKALFSIEDFLKFLRLFEKISQKIYEDNPESPYGIRIGIAIRELLKSKSKTVLLRINRPLLIKGWLDVPINEFKKRNHRIRLDLFLISIFEKQVLQKPLKLKINAHMVLNIVREFTSSLNPEIFVSDIDAIFPIIQSIVRQFKSQNSLIYEKWNECFQELISIIDKMIIYFIRMNASTIKDINYETLSHVFFILRFFYSNFQYPYNSFFSMSNTNFSQALIFHEMVHFSTFPKELLNKLFFDQENDRIPFLTDDYYLSDIFGNKYSFVQTSGIPFKTISSNEKNYLTDSFQFNYFPGMTFVHEVVNQSYNISYTIPRQLTLTFMKKILGSTDGFIIEVMSLYGKIEHLYVKELFCYSQNFATQLAQRIQNIGKRDIEMPSDSVSKIVELSLDEKELFFTYHNDPYIEMFGYLLLESLKMCPKFVFYRSVFDLKTYIIMKEIERNQFCNLAAIELMIKDCSFDTMYPSMEQFHKLLIFHSIFCFNDFNDQNYALGFENDSVIDILLIDLWPCPYFLSVSELFHKMTYSAHNKIIEAFYDHFNNVIPNEDETNIIYSKLTLSCFSSIVQLLSKDIDLTQVDLSKALSSEIVGAFIENKMKYLEINKYSSNQLNNFVVEAYKSHVIHNIAQMFVHFCFENDKYLVDMIYNLLNFERVLYDNGNFTLQRVTRIIMEGLYQPEMKIIIILDPEEIKKNERLIIKSEYDNANVIILLFQEGEFRSNIVSIDTIRCSLEAIGFSVQYSFVAI